MSAIDEVIWLLEDGEWHNLEEIAEKASLPRSKLDLAISFLQEYNFIQVNEEGQTAKLCPIMLNFMNEIESVEEDEALSHEGFYGLVSVDEF